MSSTPSPIDAILGQVRLSQATLEIHGALNALEELRVYALSLEAKIAEHGEEDRDA